MKTGKRHLKFFQYVGDTPIVPTKLKIIIFFVAMLLLSTFSTNLVAIMLSQRKTIQLSNIVLVDKLTELYNVANSQKQIEAYSQDTQTSIDSIAQSAKNGFAKDEKNSVALGVNPDGSLLFFATPNEELKWERFTDKDCLEMMENSETHEGSVSFISPDGDEYFGVYKYHPDWLTYIIRANRRSDTNRAMYQVLWITVVLVLIMSAFFILMGTKILDGLLSNIYKYSTRLYKLLQD